jgi:ABC-type lipoprotein release transport system permease subunit
MEDLRLAWRNVWRHPRRTLLTILAISFAALLLVFMLSLQFGSYREMINAAVRLGTGHLQVQAQGFHEEPRMRLTVDHPAAVVARLRHAPGVTGVSCRAQSFVLAASAYRTRGILVEGVDPVHDSEISTVNRQIRAGRYLEPGDGQRAVIGALLADRLRVAPGDELTLLGQGYNDSVAATVVKIVGVFRSGIDDYDRTALQLPLAAFDEVFAMGGRVHRVVAAVDRLAAVPGLKAVLAADDKLAGLAVLDWSELLPGIKQSIQLDLVSGFITYSVLLVVVAFSILNTFLMAIFERTREFGVLMAIGTPPRRLVRLVLLESAIMSWLGVLAGTVAGAAFVLYFGRTGISMGGAADLLRQYGMEGRIHPWLNGISLTVGPALVLGISVVTALLPAWRISRLRPVDALRSG